MSCATSQELLGASRNARLVLNAFASASKPDHPAGTCCCCLPPLQAVQRLRIYTPLAATAAVVMIVGSMIATNVSVVAASGLAIITAVLTLHSCGFGLGYFISKGLGLSDRVCRTNAIEVGVGWCAGGGGTQRQQQWQA